MDDYKKREKLQFDISFLDAQIFKIKTEVEELQYKVKSKRQDYVERVQKTNGYSVCDGHVEDLVSKDPIMKDLYIKINESYSNMRILNKKKYDLCVKYCEIHIQITSKFMGCFHKT